MLEGLTKQTLLSDHTQPGDRSTHLIHVSPEVLPGKRVMQLLGSGSRYRLQLLPTSDHGITALCNPAICIVMKSVVIVDMRKLCKGAVQYNIISTLYIGV